MTANSKKTLYQKAIEIVHNKETLYLTVLTIMIVS